MYDNLDDPNTCQRALTILAQLPGAEVCGHNLLIRRKIAEPGQLSDGTREFHVSPCPRFRWITVVLGWNQLAEIDQRQFGFDAEAMAEKVMDVLQQATPVKYREELTPAGLQLCIPGTERIPPQTGKPAQLSLFP